MKKSQIIAVVLGIVCIGALYSLPRVVVENESDTDGITDNTSQVDPVTLHDAPVSEEVKGLLAQKLDELGNTDDLEKKIVLSESIAEIYDQNGKLDSAAYYLEIGAKEKNLPEYWEKAGSAYYEAFTFALNEEKVNHLALKTREYLEKVLEKDPNRLDLKTKVAMTFVSSSNPMQGITMLREILETDPTNEDALFNMGVLSMQSGQYKRATERFEQLVLNHPANLQGQFYLGVSYFESKQNNKAKKQFQLVQDMTQDPMVLASVESYLDRL